VLETIFDGPKIHLTEKILRPIACGHPFILAAGPGSLEYLRSYGFKTFAPWIDESYDNETNSVRRLESIVDTMDSFSRLSSTNKQRVINKLNAIADYNKKWFFSDAFANAINQELTTNINIALKQVGQTRANIFRMREKNITNKHSRSDSRNFVAQHLNNLRKLNPPGK
jgi:GTPase involved in cell partitioning and DNA repair